MRTKKELGQNFLFDKSTLAAIANYGCLSADDTVLEIGPGLGTLTSELCQRAGRVVAVEFDDDLASSLSSNVAQQLPNVSNLTVKSGDILRYDLTDLPADYKVVANIPYNITSKIVEKLWTADNKPQTAVLLVQREVAERLAAGPGQMSVLSIATQVFADVELGIVVSAGMFTPAPKVDSQVVIMQRRAMPPVNSDQIEQFLYVVKAGFAERRKKLRSSLAVGLRTSKVEAERLLAEANVDANKRAQELSIDDWKRLAKCS